MSVQRLPNGNTFIPCNDQLIEVDRRGKEVFRAMVAGIAAARRLPDGRIVAFDRNEIIQLDKGGNEVKRSPVMIGGAGCNEVLDNGHVLTLSPGMGNLTEFDQDGTEINHFDQPGAAHAFPPAERTYAGHGQGNQVRRAGQELAADQRNAADG